MKTGRVCLLAIGFAAVTSLAGSDKSPRKTPKAGARGPLRVHPDNPRYFTDGSGKAIYLTGSHTWNNLVDIGVGDPPPAFDFPAHLDFLERHHHNFIRLWRWELLFWDAAHSPQWTDHKDTYGVTPHPWKRDGPGVACDGKPKFDLSRFDDAYFARLRRRVEAAGQRGIYVSVMLFEGWGLQHFQQGWVWRTESDGAFDVGAGSADGQSTAAPVGDLKTVSKPSEQPAERL